MLSSILSLYSFNFCCSLLRLFEANKIALANAVNNVIAKLTGLAKLFTVLVKPLIIDVDVLINGFNILNVATIFNTVGAIFNTISQSIFLNNSFANPNNVLFKFFIYCNTSLIIGVILFQLIFPIPSFTFLKALFIAVPKFCIISLIVGKLALESDLFIASIVFAKPLAIAVFTFVNEVAIPPVDVLACCSNEANCPTPSSLSLIIVSIKSSIDIVPFCIASYKSPPTAVEV